MISILYNILLFLVPLFFFKTTSELFEFNKIITLYIFTILITSTWLIKSIISKKFIFRRTILDWPLIIFLTTLILSTIFSIDFRTSILGYYSRFNGSLISTICYALLYWSFVSNMNKKLTKKAIVYFLISTGIASLLAILEHFGFSTTCGLMGLGFNNSCWVQDVQARVFSTFGQPNWLAATIVILIPISFAVLKDKLILFYFSLLIFFITLTFTKSRSGLLAFAVSDIIFSSLILIKFKREFLKKLVMINIVFALLVLIIGSPITPSIFELKKNNNQKTDSALIGPALETGGTESGVIRKIVWQGAFKIWTNYKIFGTGPETFAFSYPMFKPLEHNLTSEWDFIYNKAHNEYLNYLATTGIVGFLSYLTLIGFIFYQLIKTKSLFGFSLLAGFVSILITNFFGFSVVATSLLFFLIPAFAVTEKLKDEEEKLEFSGLDLIQKIYISFLILISIYFIYLVSRYFLADIYYNKARLLNRSNNPTAAIEEITKALNFSPKEAIFWGESATANTNIAVLLAENNEPVKGQDYANKAINESEKSILLSPYNLNLKKNQIGIYYKLLVFDNNYLSKAESTAKSAITISPNDPKLYYQLGLLDIKLNKLKDAVFNLEKSVLLKPNYKEARYALGSIYKNIGDTAKANENFLYILEKIDPNDELTKKLYNEAP